ncbi:TPA: hypothetical protein ACRZ3R_004980 [Vibrio harveyi]
MFRTLCRVYRNKISKPPRIAILRQAIWSRLFVACALILIGLSVYGIHQFDDDSNHTSGSYDCVLPKVNSIESITDPIQKELASLACELKHISKETGKSEKPFFSKVSPLLTLLALSLAATGLLFNVIIASYRWTNYVTYEISTSRNANRFSGSVTLKNKNEMCLTISKAYFKDCRQQKSVYSEIPLITLDKNDVVFLKYGEPIRLKLLAYQAEIAQTFPDKIDIVLSTNTGKAMCIRGKADWKPNEEDMI